MVSRGFTGCTQAITNSEITDIYSHPLDFRHPPRRYSIHPCSTEGANRWRLLAEQGRRLRVRPTQPNLRGSWETPPGPTTWVRPKGLVKRMNAGRNPCGMIVIGGGHCPFQKAVPRLKENAAVGRREARRSALWAGSSLPQEGQA